MRRLLLGIALLGTPVLAGDFPYPSSNGFSYRATENQNGVVLTSTYPRVFFSGVGAATQIIEKPDVIYLGRSCDAYSENSGPGTWGWANGGFCASFPGVAKVCFPRQDPPFQEPPLCPLP